MNVKLNIVRYCLKDTTDRIYDELRRTRKPPSDDMHKFLMEARRLIARITEIEVLTLCCPEYRQR